jgi:hypothetical protein
MLYLTNVLQAYKPSGKVTDKKPPKVCGRIASLRKPALRDFGA